jgi:hypothetical protein
MTISISCYLTPLQVQSVLDFSLALDLLYKLVDLWVLYSAMHLSVSLFVLFNSLLEKSLLYSLLLDLLFVMPSFWLILH